MPAGHILCPERQSKQSALFGPSKNNGVPEKIRFIAHRARFGDDASRRKAHSPSLRDTSPGGRGKDALPTRGV